MIKIKKLVSYREHLKESLKDPEFRKAWKESEAEYLLDCQKIEKRLKKIKLSSQTQNLKK